MTLPPFRRGDIVLVDFSPAREHEADFVRPAVVVTNDHANLYAPTLMVVPLTSNITSVHAYQVFLPRQKTGLDRDSKAQIELTRGIARSRVKRVLSVVPEELMVEIDMRLAEHLDLGRRCT